MIPHIPMAGPDGMDRARKESVAAAHTPCALQYNLSCRKPELTDA